MRTFVVVAALLAGTCSGIDSAAAKGCNFDARFDACECSNLSPGVSHNYTVPPLYSYRWPGMYRQPRMIDYQHPSRFPFLKPFNDDKPLIPIGGIHISHGA